MIEIAENVWVAVDKIVCVRLVKDWQNNNSVVVVKVMAPNDVGGNEFKSNLSLFDILTKIEACKNARNNV